MQINGLEGGIFCLQIKIYPDFKRDRQPKSDNVS